jgi:hypothetical protein
MSDIYVLKVLFPKGRIESLIFLGYYRSLLDLIRTRYVDRYTNKDNLHNYNKQYRQLLMLCLGV